MNTGLIHQSAIRIVNSEIVDRWQQCKKDLYECIKAAHRIQENRSFAFELAGDINSDFTLIIHFIPRNSGENRPTKITSVSNSTNLTPRHPENLKRDEVIHPYTGLSQSFTRIDKDKISSITLNLEGNPPITVSLPPDNKSSSGVPVETIASTLTYSELCQSLNEQITFSVNNTLAPADGRSVSGSIYGDIHNSVPDLRGLFLRGLNKFYDDNNGASQLTQTSSTQITIEVLEASSQMRQSYRIPDL